jgi:alpha-L-fucosidase
MIVRPGIPDELRWFHESRFGMFVHFGLYALLGRGEWVMYHENIPRNEYEKLVARFNPDRFDADQWVSLAREAGARYITVTAKHHDGFCLFDSELTDFKITNSPFGRDLITELAEACRRQSVRIIFYYSQPDWHHPNYLHWPGAFKDLPNPPSTDRPDWPKYVEYYQGQVRELCTKYGKIDGIWFDGSHKTEQMWQGRRVYEMIKHYQPHAVVNDRARWGDFFTPERSLPEDLTGYLFEACESISPTSWGYQGDTATHSVPYLVRSLVRMASGGGNYLLNVGPKPDGTIPDDQALAMRLVGEWLRRHGASIYATEAGPRIADPSLRATRTADRLYLHLLDWPKTNRLSLPEVAPDDIGEARLMGDGSQLSVVGTNGGVELRGLPLLPPDPSVNVVEMTLVSIPKLLTPSPRQVVERPTIAVSREGATTLRPEDAEFEGFGVKGARLRIRRNEKTGRSFITSWMVPDHAAHWNLGCAEPGRYAVSVFLGAPETHAGAVLKVALGGQEVTAVAPNTGSLDAVEEVQMGTVRIPRGRSRLTLTPHELKWGYLSPDIEKIVLTAV